MNTSQFIDTVYYSSEINNLGLLDILNIEGITLFSFNYYDSENDETYILNISIKYSNKTKNYIVDILNNDACIFIGKSLSEACLIIKTDFFFDKNNNKDYIDLIEGMILKRYNEVNKEEIKREKEREKERKKREEERKEIEKEREKEREKEKVLIKLNKEKYAYLLDGYYNVDKYFRDVFHEIKNCISRSERRYRNGYSESFVLSYISNLDEIYKSKDGNFKVNVGHITCEIDIDRNYYDYYDSNSDYDISFDFIGHTYTENEIMLATNNFVSEYSDILVHYSG